MSSADRVAHIDGNYAIIVSNTHALPSGYNASNKTEQSIYECFITVLTTFSAPPQILAASIKFRLIPETKK